MVVCLRTGEMILRMSRHDWLDGQSSFRRRKHKAPLYTPSGRAKNRYQDTKSGEVIEAFTKSEARAALKERLKSGKLPAGTSFILLR